MLETLIVQNPRDPDAQRRLAAARERREFKKRKKSRYRAVSASESDEVRELYGSTLGPLGLYARLAKVKVKRGKSRPVVRVPRTFSFIEAPDATLEAVEVLVGAGVARRTEFVHFDQGACTHLDLGAEMVAGVLLDQLEHRHVSVLGTRPEDDAMRAISQAAGVTQVFGDKSADPQFNVFGVRKGRRARARPGAPGDAASCVEDLTDYINEVLREGGRELLTEAAAAIAEILGELLDNAEEHATYGDWWVSGYLRRKEGETVGDLHLTIFNFGRSIADTLQELPPEAHLRAEIEDLVALHTDSGLFQRRWQPDDLWTLYALQSGVSSLRTSADPEHEDPDTADRGQGLANIISAFHAIADDRERDQPRLRLISGRTSILIDGKYWQDRANDHKVIAFNPENSLEKTPDRRYVSHLNRGFPGTILSIRFDIGREDLDGAQRD